MNQPPATTPPDQCLHGYDNPAVNCPICNAYHHPAAHRG